MRTPYPIALASALALAACSTGSESKDTSKGTTASGSGTGSDDDLSVATPVSMSLLVKNFSRRPPAVALKPQSAPPKPSLAACRLRNYVSFALSKLDVVAEQLCEVQAVKAELTKTVAFTYGKAPASIATKFMPTGASTGSLFVCANDQLRLRLDLSGIGARGLKGNFVFTLDGTATYGFFDDEATTAGEHQVFTRGISSDSAGMSDDGFYFVFSDIGPSEFRVASNYLKPATGFGSVQALLRADLGSSRDLGGALVAFDAAGATVDPASNKVFAEGGELYIAPETPPTSLGDYNERLDLSGWDCKGATPMPEVSFEACRAYSAPRPSEQCPEG